MLILPPPNILCLAPSVPSKHHPLIPLFFHAKLKGAQSVCNFIWVLRSHRRLSKYRSHFSHFSKCPVKTWRQAPVQTYSPTLAGMGWGESFMSLFSMPHMGLVWNQDKNFIAQQWPVPQVDSRKNPRNSGGGEDGTFLHIIIFHRN